MSEYEPDLSALESQFGGLETTLGGLEGVTAAFRRELDGAEGSLRDTGREAVGMSRSISGSLRRAFEGILFDGKRAGDALRGVGQSLSSAVLNQALAPVQGAIGSAIGGGLQSMLGSLLPFANGGVLASGRVQAFASGGIVGGPTMFPMRGGTGLMGEAGPEAIMPLARGPDGRLGVRSGGGGGRVQVTMNITTPNAESFRRSRSQVAAELSRAIQRGGRNL
jgi:phage-related minor tail protein